MSATAFELNRRRNHAAECMKHINEKNVHKFITQHKLEILPDDFKDKAALLRTVEHHLASRSDVGDIAANLRAKGAPAADAAPAGGAGEDLHALTKAELEKRVKAAGKEVPNRASKADLIALLTAPAAEDETDDVKATVRVVDGAVFVVGEVDGKPGLLTVDQAVPEELAELAKAFGLDEAADAEAVSAEVLRQVEACEFTPAADAE